MHTRVLNFTKELLDLRVVSYKVFVLQIKEEFQVDRIVILRCVLVFVKVNNLDEVVCFEPYRIFIDKIGEIKDMFRNVEEKDVLTQ